MRRQETGRGIGDAITAAPARACLAWVCLSASGREMKGGSRVSPSRKPKPKQNPRARTVGDTPAHGPEGETHKRAPCLAADPRCTAVDDRGLGAQWRREESRLCVA
jgi:hypothetical protein